MNLTLKTNLLILAYLFLFVYQKAFCRVMYNGFQIKDLFSNLPDFQQELFHWKISSSSTSSPIIACPAIPFFGTLSLFDTPGSYVERSYNTLPIHNMLTYSIWFLVLGPWGNGDGFKVILSSSTISQTITFTNTQSTFASNFFPISCGNVYYGLNDLHFMGKMAHSGRTLKIRVESNLKVPSTGAFFNFREVSFLFTNSTAPVPPIESYASSDYLITKSYSIANGWPCKRNEYRSASSCLACHANCYSCFGANETDCFACATGFFYDGKKCIRCHLTCEYCRGPTDRDCTKCYYGHYFLDGVCVLSCNAPFSATYYYSRYCIYPCKEGEYLYPDKLCYPTCDKRFTNVTVSYKQLCTFPCPAGAIMYYDGNCSYQPCPSPLIMKKYGGFQICDYPCEANEIFYTDGTCKPACTFPYVIKNSGIYQICEPPCSSSSNFSFYWENSCRNTCPSPLQQRVVNNISVCDPPQCGGKFCDLCKIGNTCPEYYYCNVTSPSGKFCMPYFSYKLVPQEIRTVTNGIILSAEVIPKKGIIPGVNDTLLFHIQGYYEGLDYTAKIEKIDKASFMIYVELLRSLNTSSSLVGHFQYGPLTLGLKENLKLPRLIFIPITTQLVAQKGKSGSQILFLIFLISIISCVLGGGLSIIWSALPETQYGFYLRYLNVPYLHHTEVYFQSLTNYDMLISDESTIEHLSPDLKENLPRRFFLVDYSPSFIDNGGEVVLQFLLIVTGLAFSIILLKYVKFTGRGILIFKILDFLKKTFKWNGLLRHSMTFALALSTSSFIQIHSAIFGKSVYFPSLFLALASLVGVLASFYIMFYLLANIPRQRYERIVYSKQFGTLWEDLDVGSFVKYYYWLITLRGFLLAYLCVFFELFPYFQIITIITYQCGIVIFFIKGVKLRRVFSDNTLNKVTFGQEICLLLEKVAILVFLILHNSVTDNTLILLGWVIVIPAAAMQIIQTLYSFCSQLAKRAEIIKMLKHYLLKRSKRRVKKIKRKNLPRISIKNINPDIG